MTPAAQSQLPLVSGIVAAYNYERYLAEALDSALAQDYPADRLEIIVVDDGSTDATDEIAKRYAARFEGRISYVRQDNAGPAAATTRGLELARGDFITLLDADDVWLTSRTRLLVDALARNPRAGLVYGDMEVIDAEGRVIAPSWLQEARQVPFHGRVVANLLRSNFVMTSALMVRASLRDRYCPIPSSFPTQDWPIVAGVAEVAEVDFLPAVVTRYRRHGANLSNGKHSPGEVAALLRRDVPMRRWMLTHLRSDDLTVEDYAAAYDYFLQTLRYVSGVDRVSPQSIVEVSRTEHLQALRALQDGESALARADFTGAASHFLAALAAAPFDPRARAGLDHAERRLVVPEPREIEPADPSEYHIRSGYSARAVARYFVDLVEGREGIVRAPEVHARAAEVATRLRATRIIDLGAGAGCKLAAVAPRFEILGLDHGPNLELARRAFAAWTWREHDLDSEGALPCSDDELEGAVVVCANVIERLGRPDRLLAKLSAIRASVQAIVISTVERDLTRGPDDLGPPADPHNVREWNLQEFAALLDDWGFEHGEIGLTRTDGAIEDQHTILAVLYPDADRARGADAAAVAAA